jgi:hypothetical protein
MHLEIFILFYFETLFCVLCNIELIYKRDTLSKAKKNAAKKKKETLHTE